MIITYAVIVILALVGLAQVLSKTIKAIKKMAPTVVFVAIIAFLLYAFISTNSSPVVPQFTASAEPNWDEIIKDAQP